MEHRRPANAGTKTADLPVDFLKMVKEVFTTTFDAGLKEVAKLKSNPQFSIRGRIYPQEVVLCITLLFDGQIAATSAYASVDFDPKASSPTIQDLLGLCVDALASVYETLLDPKHPERIEQLADESLSAMDEVPFEWTLVQVDKKKIYVKMDKANPVLDEAADEWLKRNDPEALKKIEDENRAAEELIVTGKKKGTVH